MPDVRSFYDALAGDYHRIYADWEQSVRRQGEVLDRLIRCQSGGAIRTVLDCSCGIGTQAIGLALRGYVVSASDISAASVERVRRESVAFDVRITFHVADIRHLADMVPGTFDVVISCDNSLPHLLTDDDLAAALRNMRQKVNPGGMVVIGIRDYDDAVHARPRVTTPLLREGPDGRSITFQVWEWEPDGRGCALNQFVLVQDDASWETRCHTTRYRALLRNELSAMLASAGYTGITWHTADATGHHQPLVTARA